MTTNRYHASIVANEGDDFTSDVDIRTLPDHRLVALRAEAVAAGDNDLVSAIDSLPDA